MCSRVNRFQIDLPALSGRTHIRCTPRGPMQDIGPASATAVISAEPRRESH